MNSTRTLFRYAFFQQNHWLEALQVTHSWGKSSIIIVGWDWYHFLKYGALSVNFSMFSYYPEWVEVSHNSFFFYRSHYYVSNGCMNVHAIPLICYWDRATRDRLCDQPAMSRKTKKNNYWNTCFNYLDTGIIQYHIVGITICIKFESLQNIHEKNTCSSDPISCTVAGYKNSKNIFMKMILLSYIIPWWKCVNLNSFAVKLRFLWFFSRFLKHVPCNIIRRQTTAVEHNMYVMNGY